MEMKAKLLRVGVPIVMASALLGGGAAFAPTVNAGAYPDDGKCYADCYEKPVEEEFFTEVIIDGGVVDATTDVTLTADAGVAASDASGGDTNFTAVISDDDGGVDDGGDDNGGGGGGNNDGGGNNGGGGGGGNGGGGDDVVVNVTVNIDNTDDVDASSSADNDNDVDASNDNDVDNSSDTDVDTDGNN